MKSVVVYVKGHEVSERHKNKLVQTLERYDWDYELMEGVTPDTLDQYESYDDLVDGRLGGFKTSEPVKYPIKKSCVTNHLRFAQMVIDRNEPMIFLEHDQFIVSKPIDIEFEDYCQLNTEYAFKPPTALAQSRFIEWDKNQTPTLGVSELPEDWPLLYYKKSIYMGSKMVPGTGAYALSPSGARKLLDAVKQHGMEQSDFLYNTNVMKIETVFPSPVRFQSTNPNLSHGL
jgi:GR25 family glycosyltransferase involved in LPS biosynthesis